MPDFAYLFVIHIVLSKYNLPTGCLHGLVYNKDKLLQLLFRSYETNGFHFILGDVACHIFIVIY